MTEPRGTVSPPVAVAFSVLGFFALLIAGFGMLSLLSGSEVLSVAGLGPLPGILGVGFAVAAFAISVWSVVRRPAPTYGGVPFVVIAAFLGFLAGLLVGGVVAGTDAARVASAAGGFATSWFAVVLASVALVCGWSAVALVRTHASRPRWPWEDRER